jgi:SNF2 family DNA or RNA helicase
MSTTSLLGAVAIALMHENEEVLEELLRRSPDDEELLERAKKRKGLPTFFACIQSALKLGRFDVIIERVGDGDFRFLYAPGSDVFNPAPGPKIKWVEEWLVENPEEPLVLAAQGVPTIDGCAKMLEKHGISYRLIRGGVEPEDRVKFNDEFQDGKVRVMLVQQLAGSESIDLTRASTSMLVDHDLSPITYTQFLHRTNRQGQDEECDHIDMSFCQFQTTQIKRLIDGELFDAQAREVVEKEVQYQRVIAHPEMIA